jgi:nucleotide-binding universal stress UspA family protein
MTVLAPIDGSDCSVRGLEFACEFADRFDASLHVVHFSDAETDATEQLVEDARPMLADAGVTTTPNPSSRRTCRSAPPAASARRSSAWRPSRTSTTS